MTDFDVIELQNQGGTIIKELADAIKFAEDVLYVAVVAECPSTFELNPIRLWIHGKWYEVREMVTGKQDNVNS